VNGMPIMSTCALAETLRGSGALCALHIAARAGDHRSCCAVSVETKGGHRSFLLACR